MTLKYWSIIGFLATLIIAVVLPVYALAEADRMAAAQAHLLRESVTAGEVIYAENCVICHGAAGEGIGAFPALDNDGVRQMDHDTLYKTIERGRYGTAMAAWGVSEGGVLNEMEIDQPIAMLQAGNWQTTAQTVARLGHTPPEPVTVEISEQILADLSALPHGETIAAAMPVYAANCAACHGPQGEGSGIAPALNAFSLRESRTDAELARTITNGVPGTLMAGWEQALTPINIDELVGLIRNFDEIPAGAIPQPELPPIASTDAEVIAAGARMFNIACAQCHGADGQGTPMAPALNVQSFLADTNDQAIKAIISNGVPGTQMPAWGGRLSDNNLNALVSFIRSWEPTAPAVAQPMSGGAAQPGAGPPWLRNNP